MASEHREEIGVRIRRLRQAAEMTQSELAERAELTAGFISQLERGVVSVSIDSLLMILAALNVHISDFFRPEPRKIVFGADEAIALEREGVQEFLALVTGGANRQMEPAQLSLAPGQEIRLEVFSGEQFGHVLTGTLSVFSGERSDKARRGQSFYMDGNNVTRLRNDSARPVQFLWITSPPFF